MIIKVAPMHDCVHVKVGRPNYDDICPRPPGAVKRP